MVSQGFEPISLTFSSDSLQNKTFQCQKNMPSLMTLSVLCWRSVNQKNKFAVTVALNSTFNSIRFAAAITQGRFGLLSHRASDVRIWAKSAVAKKRSKIELRRTSSPQCMCFDCFPLRIIRCTIWTWQPHSRRLRLLVKTPLSYSRPVYNLASGGA